ncbi:MAG: hypothetical protein WCZ21_07085 [Bacteroidales bacterium]|jgi:hypothetical protein
MKHIIIKNALIVSFIFFFSSCCETVPIPYCLIVNTDKNTHYEVIYDIDNKDKNKKNSCSGFYSNRSIDYGVNLCHGDFTPKVQIIRKSGDGLIQVFASKYDAIQINGDTISPFDANCNVSIDSIFSYLKSVNHKCYMELTPSQTSKSIVLEEQPNRIQ